MTWSLCWQLPSSTRRVSSHGYRKAELATPSSLLYLHSELLPALICEGIIDDFIRHFSKPLGTSVSVSACKANLFFFFSWQYCSVLFTGCVISVFCLCLQGWPMNRQLCKGPQIFHRPVSESRAYLPTGQVLPLFCPDQLSPGVSGASFLQNSVTHHYLTVFGTFASS